MSQTANTKLIGAFVVVAFTLLFVGVIAFGSRQLYSPREQAVVVFDSSVRGLSKGSVVSYQGVTIGEVVEIYIRKAAKSDTLLMPVVIELQSDVIQTFSDKRYFVTDDDISQTLSRMRARMVPQSLLTGRLMIELEYAPEQPGTTYQINFDLPQIPAQQSRLEMATEGLTDTIEQIKQMPLADIAQQLDRLLISLNRVVEGPQLNQILDNATAATDGFNQLAQLLSQQLPRALADLERTLATTRQAANDVSDSASRGEQTFVDASQWLADSRSTVAQLESTLRQGELTLASYEQLVDENSSTRQQLDLTLQELNRTLRSANSLLETLNRQPQALIYGKQ